VSNQFSYPYKTTGKIIVLYTLTFKFLIAHWKAKDSAQNDRKHSLTECNTAFRNVGTAQSEHTVAVGHECLIPSSTECRAHKPSHVMSIGFMPLGVKRLGREAD